MKRKALCRIICVLLLTFWVEVKAQSPSYSDSVEVSLLTCGAGEEVWAQYGHTAIRWNDRKTGEDIVVNYGIFSQNQPYFLLRFIFGLTDYKVDTQSMTTFLRQYAYEGRSVVEQTLNLTPSEKQQIYAALIENLKPKNVVYRYNFFYDNCTTRAHHLLLKGLKGRLQSQWRGDSNMTYRRMIHQWNAETPWVRLGEDLLLGIEADQLVTTTQQLFLPDNLRKYYGGATINGRPLVSETHTLLYAATPPITNISASLTPLTAAIVFAILASVVFVMELWRKKKCRVWNIFLTLTSGIIGLVLFAMVFSEHPCVDVNAILLFFNPLALVLLFGSLCKRVGKKMCIAWFVWEVMIFIGLITAIFQSIPLPILIVASFLLLNCGMQIYFAKCGNAHLRKLT